MTYERTAVVDFSTPFALVDCVIIIRKPENAVSIFALIWLFRPIVWLVYFTSIVAAIVMTWFLGKQVITDDCHHIHPNTESLYSTAFYIYSAQVNQRMYCNCRCVFHYYILKVFFQTQKEYLLQYQGNCLNWFGGLDLFSF